MSWPKTVRALMFCNSFSTWILLVYLKLQLWGDLVTVFLYNCSNAGLRTEIVSKVMFFYVGNMINNMSESC